MSRSHLLLLSLPVILSIAAQTRLEAGNPRFQESTSYDGTLVIYVNAEDGDSEIYIESADGTGRRRLTSNDSYDNDPSVSPDGQRIAFASDRSGTWQIYTMNLDGDEIEAVTDGSTESILPKYGARGELAYLVRRGQLPKRKLFDLVVSDGARVTCLQEEMVILDFGWHPDGRQIACSTDGAIILQRIDQTRAQTVTFADIDPRLGRLGAFDLTWSSQQQAFVGRLRFLGGVPQGHHPFGDGEKFVLSPAGDLTLPGLQDATAIHSIGRKR